MVLNKFMLTSAAVLCVVVPANAELFSFSTPSDDRWHYPFNFTPGSRAIGSTFGAVFAGFNDRDGVNVIAWDTSTDISTGQGISGYRIKSIRVTMTNQGSEFVNPAWPVDLTPDEWFTFDLDGDGFVNSDGFPRGDINDTDGESDDLDPGRTIELFGAGFGPTYTAATWFESSFFEGSGGDADLPRDPFPFVYQEGSLEILHVEDNVKGLHNDLLSNPVFSFTPVPWAVGVPQDYIPGAQSTPFDVTFDVNLDLSSNAVREYFQEQLDSGRVIVIATSLRETAVQGSQSGFPSFYMKEGLFDPGAKAPSLDIEFCEVEPLDRNGDCRVDVIDYPPFVDCLGGPGGALPSQCAELDVTGDNAVDLSDYQLFQCRIGDVGLD